MGLTSADVTEGTRAGPIVNWERCQYDWSTPGRVIATVTDSNVYATPASKWEITATPNEAGGSHVEMIWTREFKRGPRDDSSERSSASSATASSAAMP